MSEPQWRQFAFTYGKIVLGVTASSLIAAALVCASRNNVLPSAPDQFTYDWRTALFSDTPAESRDDIAVVLIDETTLDGYAYTSPIDRGLLARLIVEIDSARPKAIGLDIIFDRPTEPAKDDTLLAAIRSAAAPIILGRIDTRVAGVRSAEFDFQDRFLASIGRPTGQLLLAGQTTRTILTDQAIRFMPAQTSPASPLFARLLSEIDGAKPEPATPYITWLSEPKQLASPTFPTYRVANDRAANPSTRRLPTQAWLAALRDKTVLIGGSFIDRDQHLTPFSILDNSRMPGVLIHAQILAQLRDGRSIKLLSAEQETILLAAIFSLAFAAVRRWALDRSEWIPSVAALSLLICVSLALFWGFRLIIPSSTLILAWSIGLFAGKSYPRFFSWFSRRMVAMRPQQPMECLNGQQNSGSGDCGGRHPRGSPTKSNGDNESH